jgi:hypothetical protein
MRIPPPPWWIFPTIMIIAAVLILSSCSNPRRFDRPRTAQQELQKQQDECERRGGNPQQCRP